MEEGWKSLRQWSDYQLVMFWSLNVLKCERWLLWMISGAVKQEEDSQKAKRYNVFCACTVWSLSFDLKRMSVQYCTSVERSSPAPQQLISARRRKWTDVQSIVQDAVRWSDPFEWISGRRCWSVDWRGKQSCSVVVDLSELILPESDKTFSYEM